MPANRPSPVPTWIGIVLVLVGAGVVILAGSAAGTAVPADAPAGVDTPDGLDNTTDDTTSTVEETTDDGTKAVDSTSDTLESDTEPLVNQTSETVSGAATTTTAAIDGTTLDAEAVLTVTSNAEDGDGTANTSLAGGADESAGSPGREDLDTGVAGAPPAGPARPLSTGAVVLGGVLIGGIAAQRALTFATVSGRSGVDVVRTGGRAVVTAAKEHCVDRCWRVAAFLRYHRYDDSDPLEHDGRAAIHRVIEETDGAYLSEISRATAIPISTVRYHLRILEHERVVTAVKMRGKRLYFPAGSEPSELTAALKDDGPAAVLRALARQGPETVSGLAATLDRDVSTVSHHLQQLAAAGLVRRERDGQTVVNRLAPAVRDTLGSHADGTEPAAAGVGLD